LNKTVSGRTSGGPIMCSKNSEAAAAGRPRSEKRDAPREVEPKSRGECKRPSKDGATCGMKRKGAFGPGRGGTAAKSPSRRGSACKGAEGASTNGQRKQGQDGFSGNTTKDASATKGAGPENHRKALKKQRTAQKKEEMHSEKKSHRETTRRTLSGGRPTTSVSERDRERLER